MNTSITPFLDTKKTKLKIIALLLIVTVAGLAAAQILDPGAPSPAGYFPAGALVYVETANLNELLEWWNNSKVKTRWEESDTYSRFQNSTLFLKLQDRLSDFGKEKYSVTFENLETLAGKRSGIAIYDIGELKILAATEVSKADASSTELWLAREKFRKRTIGDVTYYVEPDEGKLAFAYLKPYLVIASETSLIENYIALQSGKDSVSLSSSEKWQQCQAMKPSGGFLSMYLDQEKLNQNRYFKKYWIHRNVKDFSNIRAAWIDFTGNSKELTEHRYFVFNESSHPPVEAILPKTESLPDATWDYTAINSAPHASEISRELMALVNQFPEDYRDSSYPPAFSASADRASAAEIKNTYLQRIDEPLLRAAGETVLRADQESKLTAIIADAAPVQHVRLSHPLWDDIALFMQFRNVLMVRFQNANALNREELLEQLRQHFLILASVQDQGASWRLASPDTYTLDSLLSLHIRFSDSWMIASNSIEDLERASSLSAGMESLNEGAAVRINLENGRWKYARFMRRLDYGVSSEEGPLFFSENIVGLLDTLSDLKRSTIVRAKNIEVVRYDLQ